MMVMKVVKESKNVTIMSGMANAAVQTEGWMMRCSIDSSTCDIKGCCCSTSHALTYTQRHAR